MTWNKPLLLIVLLVAVVAFVTTIEIEPPQKYRGTMQVTGRISECTFDSLNRSSMFFLGVKLSNPEAPYLRMNPERVDRARFERMCRDKPLVRITYKAKLRVIGPVRFWIEQIDGA